MKYCIKLLISLIAIILFEAFNGLVSMENLMNIIMQIQNPQF